MFAGFIRSISANGIVTEGIKSTGQLRVEFDGLTAEKLRGRWLPDIGLCQQLHVLAMRPIWAPTFAIDGISHDALKVRFWKI
jgi:hypothetical protein